MAVDMFIKIGDIKGEAQDKEFKGTDGWIDILAWSWGASNSATTHMGGGGGSGKANVQDISVTKYVDVASYDLQLGCLVGKHHQTATIKIRKAGEKPFVYMEFELSDVLISSFSTGGSGGEDRLTENMSINFAKVKMMYNQQSKTGGLEKATDYTFNIAENAPE